MEGSSFFFFERENVESISFIFYIIEVAIEWMTFSFVLVAFGLILRIVFQLTKLLRSIHLGMFVFYSIATIVHSKQQLTMKIFIRQMVSVI